MSGKDRTREQAIMEFNKAMGHPIGAPFSLEEINFRMAMIMEEVAELQEEVTKTSAALWYHKPPINLPSLLKELADVQYVVSGFAATFGMDIQTAFNRVHESNMSKLQDDGTPLRRGDGKILKGPNYKPPVMEDLI